jgi:Sulfotransferase family
MESIKMMTRLFLLLFCFVQLLKGDNDVQGPEFFDDYPAPVNATRLFEQSRQQSLEFISNAWCALNSVRTRADEYSHLIGDISHKLALCTIPKNACTVLRSFMLTLNGHKVDMAEPLVHVNAHAKYGLCNRWDSNDKLVHVRSEDITERRRALLGANDVCRVAVVRDPALRLLSAFIDKGHNDKELRGRLYLGPPKPNSDDRQRFVDVIERLEHVLLTRRGEVKPLRNLDEHFRPQYLQCHFDAPGALDMWHLVRFEVKHVELRHALVDQCGRPDLWRVLEPLMAERTYHPTFPHRQWQHFYTEELLARVYRIYQQDYELFRYPRPTMRRFASLQRLDNR